MSRRTPAFPIRMMYATSLELIDYAARLGMNWVVPVSSGHKSQPWSNDEPPVYMPEYPRLARHRRPMRARIEALRRDARAKIAAAKKAGLKVIYHAYEPSLPTGFQDAFPQLHCKGTQAYSMQSSGTIREVCVYRPEVREALAVKVAEICRAFPDIDGYMYTNNESGTQTQAWHRCEHCKDIPFGRMQKYLHDAITEGIRRSGLPIRLFNRCWGTHETEQQYWLNYKMRADFGVTDLPDKAWLASYAEARKAPHMHFSPKRDIPAYVRSLKGAATAFVYKASWADVNYHHPLNPWIGRYAGHDEICEFSFEHCIGGPQNFYILGREMQRRARLCRDRGVTGLCAVPVCWGAHDANAVSTHPSHWSLNELNLVVFAALVHDPGANLQKVTSDYLRDRYGRKLPAELARMMLDSEDVAAEANNLRGPRVSGGGLANFYYELLRYAWMFPGWRKRINPRPANLKAIFADKDRAVAKARAMVARIEQLQPKLPARAYEELHARFSDLLWIARHYQASHKQSMMLWGLKDGTIAPTLGNLERLYEYGQDLARLSARRGRPLV